MKNYLVEFLGAFFLTLAIAVAQGNAIAIGLMVLALSYVGYHISGGLYNPALAFAGWARKVVTRGHLARYVTVQVLGSIAGLLLVWFAFDDLYVHPFTDQVRLWVIFAFEALLTGLFSLVFLSVAGSKDAAHYGLVLGFSFAAVLFFGGLYNPAVALASIIVEAVIGEGLGREALWYAVVFVGGPVLGSLLAAHTHEYIHGK